MLMWVDGWCVIIWCGMVIGTWYDTVVVDGCRPSSMVGGLSVVMVCSGYDCAMV
jgi:hypothetical protein